MKKLSTILTLLVCSFSSVYAQDFAGYRTGKYTGVNGAFFNPASIVGTPYRFDLNLASVSAIIGNDQAKFTLKDFKGDNLDDQIFGSNARSANGLANISANLPSFMFNVNPKTSLAVTSRARVFANLNNINGKLIKKITEDFSNDPELPYTLNSQDNMVLNVNGWTEFGVAIARELSNKNGQKFKAGITVKYLAGVANGYMNINKLNGSLNADFVAQDAYLANTTGTLGLGFSGVNISNLSASDLTKFNGSGVGADLGFIYEWTKPEPKESDSTRIKILKPKDRGYKLRIGVSLLDVGSIGFTRDVQRSGAYNIQIDGSERYYFSNLKNIDVDNFNQKFGSQPQYFTPVAGSTSGKYSVSLPTTIQLDADYRVGKMFFLNASGQIALSDNKTQSYNAKPYSSVTITPRIETSAFGIFLPMNYNELTEINLGIGFRAGPLFVGSGSLITALEESKQADLYFGLHFGLLKKKTPVAPKDTNEK
jgi:hypothetical protein